MLVLSFHQRMKSPLRLSLVAVLTISFSLFFVSLLTPKTKWVVTASLHDPRSGSELLPLPGGTFLLVGGASNSDTVKHCEVFDPKSNTWSPTDSLQYSSAAIFHSSAVTLPYPRIVVAAEKTLEIYDTASSKWSKQQLTIDHGARPCFGLLADGRLLVVGTGDDQGELFDFQTKKSTVIARPDSIGYTPFTGTGTILLPGKGLLLFIGDKPEIFDPGTMKWHPIKPPPGNFVVEAVPLRDGRILCFDVAPSAPELLYDPATDTWTTLHDPGVSFWPGIAVLPDGKVLLVGGAHALPKNVLDYSLEAASNWFTTGSIHSGTPDSNKYIFL